VAAAIESKRAILAQQKLQHMVKVENAGFHAALNLGDGGIHR